MNGYKPTISTNDPMLMTGLRKGQWIRPTTLDNAAAPKFQFRLGNGEVAVMMRKGNRFALKFGGKILLKAGKYLVEMPAFKRSDNEEIRAIAIKIWDDIARYTVALHRHTLAGNDDKAMAYEKALEIAQKAIQRPLTYLHSFFTIKALTYQGFWRIL